LDGEVGGKNEEEDEAEGRCLAVRGAKAKDLGAAAVNARGRHHIMLYIS